MPTHWEVVGGGEAGGIVVREGKELQSPAQAWRLATGSVVMQVEAVGDRVHYYLVMGQGPPEGWVSVKAKSAVLLKERDITVERWYVAIKEMRSRKKDPAALKALAQELRGLAFADQRLKTGLATNGVIELGISAMKAFPADIELQTFFINLLGDLCLFNEYASRKAGKAGIMELAVAYFKGNMEDRLIQVGLGQLGCFLDYDFENRQQMAALGGFRHCFDVCRLYTERRDEEVVFNALAAASNPVEYYPACAEAGAAEIIAQVLSTFSWTDKVRSEAGMVARGLLRSEQARECAESFGRAGLGLEFLRAIREHLGSRPMQANGCHCIRSIATVPEHRDAVVRAGGIGVILAVIQENAREPGFCWGLAGMEDSLWNVLDSSAEALTTIQRDSPEHRAAMVRAGAVEIVRAALQAAGPNPLAQELLDALEGHCEAEPACVPQPRTGFVGRWIQNKRPRSGGIFTIAEGPAGLTVATDDTDPDEVKQWSAVVLEATGDSVATVAPEEHRDLTGKLVGGRIHWLWKGEEMLIFYPVDIQEG